MEKIKQLYQKAAVSAENLKASEKAMIFICAVFVLPLLYFYMIAPMQEASLKKARADHFASKNRYDRLKAEQDTAENNGAEVKRNQNELERINGLVLGTDAAIQLIDSISNLKEKYAPGIKFIKKNAQFERVYEKYHIFKDASGQPDETGRTAYKILPVEIAFRSDSTEFMMLLHILEGFKKMNFLVKRITASRTNDTKIEVNLLLELVIELKFNSGS